MAESSPDLDLHVLCHEALWSLQTNIITDGFRSLAEGEPVEFTIENGDDGRTKAINVSGPGGAPPQVRKASRS